MDLVPAPPRHSKHIGYSLTPTGRRRSAVNAWWSAVIISPTMWFNSGAAVFGDFAQLALQALDGGLASQRFSTLVFGAFAGVALVFSAVGISSVPSYIVRGRSREIGIRTALGAERGATCPQAITHSDGSCDHGIHPGGSASGQVPASTAIADSRRPLANHRHRSRGSSPKSMPCSNLTLGERNREPTRHASSNDDGDVCMTSRRIEARSAPSAMRIPNSAWRS